MVNNKIITNSILVVLLLVANITSAQQGSAKQFGSDTTISQDMMVRISEIEIVPEFLEEYKQILKTEASASVIKEPGVIAIFPMYQKENPTQVRIIEIYADKASYQNHLKTPHFQHYKTSTLKMVKALKLIDMDGIDFETMPLIFAKMNKDPA